MLSLTPSGGTKIAVFDKEKDKPEKFIYIKEDSRDAKPEIDTTADKKKKIFEEFLHRDKKLRSSEIKSLMTTYEQNSSPPDKLERKYEDGLAFVNTSLKHYLDYPKDVKLHAIITGQPTYRMLISGLSGSGKTTYLVNFIHYNKPKHIFLMCPSTDDPAFKKLKPEPVVIDLSTYEKEFDSGPFEIEHIPPDSVVIMDDTDTAKDAHLYKIVKSQLLERGRKMGISTIVVSHAALGGNVKHAVTQLLECEFYVIFPRSNRAHAERLLKRYVGLSQDKCNLILDIDSRAVMVKKSYPSYFIGEHSVGTLN